MSRPLDLGRVTRLWLPLAASWLFMAAEQPMLTAAVARMADQKINLAAWGSVVFPLSLVIEGPIIMLLAASTALCEDWDSYKKVRRFMMASGAALTALHVAVAFTPLFDLVTGTLLDTPPEVIEPARVGMQIMTPWTWAIAYRRFQQGILIRFDRGRVVGEGTIVRLASVGAVLLYGYHYTEASGVVLGATAVSVGVIVEAVYAGLRVQPILHGPLKSAPRSSQLLDRRRFLSFYVPLAMTPLVTLLMQPLGAAAMGRMPDEMDSLAAWGPVWTLVFIPRSVGMAYNEVVVTLIGVRGSVPALRRFNKRLLIVTTGALAILALTPLSGFWFAEVQSLAPELTSFGRVGALLCIAMPAYQVLQSWYQGALVKRRATQPITEAVVIYAVVAGGLCGLGAYLDVTPGLYWACGSFVVAGITQTAWLWARSRSVIAEYEDES